MLRALSEVAFSFEGAHTQCTRLQNDVEGDLSKFWACSILKLPPSHSTQPLLSPTQTMADGHHAFIVLTMET